jgi:hypothetical protein
MFLTWMYGKQSFSDMSFSSAVFLSCDIQNQYCNARTPVLIHNLIPTNNVRMVNLPQLNDCVYLSRPYSFSHFNYTIPALLRGYLPPPFRHLTRAAIPPITATDCHYQKNTSSRASSDPARSRPG